MIRNKIRLDRETIEKECKCGCGRRFKVFTQNHRKLFFNEFHSVRYHSFLKKKLLALKEKAREADRAR